VSILARNSKRKDKNSIKVISAVAIVFIIAICVFFRIQTQNINAQNHDESQKIDQLQQELQSEQAISDELDEYEKYVNTKQFIEEIARQRLGLVYPDEIIFKPITIE